MLHLNWQSQMEQKKCWELLAQKFNCFYTLHNNYSQQHTTTTYMQHHATCFQYKLSSVWSYIFFFLNGTQTGSQNKRATTQNNIIHSNKKPRKFANEPLSASKTFFGTLLQGLCDDRLVCIAHCICWHLIGLDLQLSYFS